MKLAEFAAFKPVDCDEFRLAIPSTSNIKIKPAVIWKLIKDMIGKDLSKFQLPIFVNEPCSVVMKGAEHGFYTEYLSEVA